MKRRIKIGGWFLGAALAIASSVPAVTWDDEPPPASPGEADYAAGMAAFRREDWKEVIRNMSLVVKRRPWHDDAYNRMGYAYRKLGDYPRAIEHYNRALELNPYHRGAMEYLGETYLERGCRIRAREILERLARVCRRVFPGNSAASWKSRCEEWQELNRAVEAHKGPQRSNCKL